MTVDEECDAMETVQVALRIRPLIDSEAARGCEVCLETVPGEPQVQVKGLAFTYNYVFPPEVGQEEFYDACVKKLVEKLHRGYNATVLAYGQTGSGKTHSMGTSHSEDKENFHNAGIIPRAVADVFRFVCENSRESDFRVTVSFVELYQEQLYDLLSNKPRDRSALEIREDNKGIVLPGLTEEEVSDVNEAMACLIRGSEGRATGSTAMNVKSSRSHAIFTVQVFQENKSDRNRSTTSKFHLVDLAGSERSKKTKTTGDRFKEGVKINQGLLALGNVISALGDGSNRGFVGYRDSKLTRLLQDSLGGNSVTLMVACVSPADYNLEETISTLRYADRARHIRNKPIINQDAKSAEIVRLNNVIQQLRLQILNEGKVLPQDLTDTVKRLEDEKIKYINLYEKYSDLLVKNKNITQLLHKALSENTNMVENAILAEAAKEKIEKKLLELNAKCNQTIEILKENGGENNETLDTISQIQLKINDLQSDQRECSQIISTLIDGEEAHPQNQTVIDSPAHLNESDANGKEEAHAMDQVARNNELKDLIKSLGEKKNLAEKLATNNQYLITYNESMQENEKHVQLLEKEKDELLHQLKIAQEKNKLDPSTMNERHAKIQSLENEISQLKKKCSQQANLIKMKEKNDMKIQMLNNEIHQMKAAKVKLIKSMRVENDRFRSWKLQHEKQIAKLSNNDRKMQTAMVRMENKFSKQQYVLKRKMEDAVAANKRLKEALERQKNAQKQRSAANSGKAENVQQWVEEELELMCSLVAAQQTLEELMEDRAILTEELEALKRDDSQNPNMATIQEDIQLRSAQIADLQQKILVGDQDNKLKAKWETVQSMVEAKIALKYLFEVAAEAKREILTNKFKDSKLEDLKRTLKNATGEISNLEEKIFTLKNKHKNEIMEIEKLQEEKVSTLIKQLHFGKTDAYDSAHSDLLERLDIVQDAFERAKNAKMELLSENAILRQEIEANKNRRQKKAPKNRVLDQSLIKLELEDFMDDEDDDSFNDPDWVAENKTKANGSKKTRSLTETLNETHTLIKRSADGSSKCGCKSNCSNKLCTCKKLGSRCGPSCKCDSEKCKNQNINGMDSSEDATYYDGENEETSPKDSQSISDNESDDATKKRRIQNAEGEKRVSDRGKKKRNFFYHDTQS